MENNTCTFCGSEVVKTSNAELYGRKYGNGICYLCRTCKASVGTHPNGKPLGILANREMKILKKCCHELFDYVWKAKKLGRSKAYMVLSGKLGIEQKDCHFGYFDTEQLIRAIEVLSNENWYKEG